MSRPLRNHAIAYDFDEHRADGRLGGTDFVTRLREEIEAPVSGRLTMSGGTASIRQSDGWRTVLLELGELVGARSRDVKAGEIIARAGVMFVHAHDLAPGARTNQHTRSRWLTPAGSSGSATPGTTRPIGEDDELMKHFYTKDSGGDLWTLANVATGATLQTRDSQIATSWNATWGVARTIGLQDHLNMLDALKKTRGAAAGSAAVSDAQVTQLATQLAPLIKVPTQGTITLN